MTFFAFWYIAEPAPTFPYRACVSQSFCLEWHFSSFLYSRGQTAEPRLARLISWENKLDCHLETNPGTHNRKLYQWYPQKVPHRNNLVPRKLSLSGFLRHYNWKLPKKYNVLNIMYQSKKHRMKMEWLHICVQNHHMHSTKMKSSHFTQHVSECPCLFLQGSLGGDH